jgi:hypothetical protein
MLQHIGIGLGHGMRLVGYPGMMLLTDLMMLNGANG